MCSKNDLVVKRELVFEETQILKKQIVADNLQ